MQAGLQIDAEMRYTGFRGANKHRDMMCSHWWGCEGGCANGRKGIGRCEADGGKTYHVFRLPFLIIVIDKYEIYMHSKYIIAINTISQILKLIVLLLRTARYS